MRKLKTLAGVRRILRRLVRRDGQNPQVYYEHIGDPGHEEIMDAEQALEVIEGLWDRLPRNQREQESYHVEVLR